MTPAPVIVQPDIERWLWHNIGHVHGLTLFAYAAVQHWPGWLYAHSIQVDARAEKKGAARDLAERARQAVCALPDTYWPDGVISYVQPIEGPFWLPDDDGLPRYCTRYEIRVHPRRSSVAAPADPQQQAATLLGVNKNGNRRPRPRRSPDRHKQRPRHLPRAARHARPDRHRGRVARRLARAGLSQ